ALECRRFAMKLPSRTTALVTLVLALTIAGGLAWNFYRARQPDIDDVGGTVLVYQIDRRAQEADGDNQVIAEVLQRRFAVDGLRHPSGEPRKFRLTLASGLKSTVSYSWVEIGTSDRRNFNLDNGARGDPQRDFAWKEASAHRGQAVTLPDSDPRAPGAGLLLQ